MTFLRVIPGVSGDLVVQGADILIGGKESCHIVHVFLWLLHLSKRACTCAFIIGVLESSDEESPTMTFHCDTSAKDE